MCILCGFERCPSSCPNYSPKNAKHYCTICGDGVYEGEEYLVNNNGEYRHYDCFYGTRELLTWLGYDVKVMEDEDE